MLAISTSIRKLTSSRLSSTSLNSCLFTFTADVVHLPHIKDYILSYIAYLPDLGIYLGYACFIL